MKKLLLSLLGVLLTGLSAGAANEAISGWGTKADTNYSSRTNSSNEWTATNCALVSVDGLICPTLNGKTSAKGTLTSPELTDGIGTLSISATNTYSENKGISLKAEIKQNGATVASHDFTVASITQKEIFSDTWTGINVSGNFTIVITNNSPSNNSSSNKDRASITSLTWTNYSYNPDAPEEVEISYDLEGTTANVTLSCATDGATIYYGFAADAITTEYSAPFAITENCTVYAYAKKGEEIGSITSLPISVPYSSFKKVIDTAANDEELSIIGDFSVLYQSGSYLILTDGTSNLLVYDSEIPDYEAGTNISEISGKVYIYNDLMEIINVTLTEGGEGATYTPLKSITGVNYNDNIFDQVEIEGCTIDGRSADGKSATIKVGEEETIALYNAFGLTYENGAGYTITGFIWRYKDNLQLCPSAITGGEVLENVEAPVIKPNTKELQPDQKVSIECATDGATIYYTIDGTEPTNASTKYEGEFSVEGDVTIKAIAFYEGDDKEMLPSEVVERTYHVWDPYCNVIDNTHETSNKGQYVQHTCTVDGVDYAMVGVHDAKQGIQMNNKTAECYIIQTGDNVGYVLKSIEVDFNSNTNDITFTVRGSNTPFSDGVGEGAKPNNIKTNGDVIGTISNTNTTVEFTKDYDYFAFYPSKTGVVYMNSVTVNYRDVKELDMTEVPSLEDFEIINVDGDMVTADVPTHPNWVTKYTVNDGEVIEFDPEENEYITVKAEELDDATLHTIKIWYEHYYHGTKSEENIFNHLTNPKVSENFNEGKTQFNFGTIGEGVKVYFTINGQNPTIETSTPANVIRRAKTVNGIYTIDSDEDKEATHSVSASNTIVEIDPTLLGDTYTIKAQAVHADTNTLSEVITRQGETTSIVELKGIGSEKAVYDLMGRKVQRPAHGIYIQEGVKVRL